MKKISFALGSRTYTFNYPSFMSSEYTRAQRVLLGGMRLNRLLFYILIFILPLGLMLYAEPNLNQKSFIFTPEQSLFVVMIVTMLLSVGLFLFVTFLNGGRFLVDPKNFFGVLTFALITTFAAVLVSPDYTNTFGTNSIKLISGVSIIIFLTLFYFVNYFVRNKEAIGRVLTLFTYGTLVLGIFSLTVNSGVYKNILVFNLLFAAPLLFAYSLFNKDRRNVIAALIAMVIAFLSTRETQFRTIEVFGILVSTFFAAIPVTFIYLSENFDQFFSKLGAGFRNLRNGITELIKSKLRNYESFVRSFELFGKILALVLPFVLLLVIAIALVQNSSVRSSVEIVFNDYKKAFSDASSVGAQAILFGEGMSFTNSSYSLFLNIFKAQGLLGILAYLFIFGLGIVQGLRTLNRTMKDKNLNITMIAIFAFYLVFVPILSLIIYPGLFLMAIWWLVFSLISLVNSNYFDKKIDYSKSLAIGGFGFFTKKFGKKGFILKYFLCILILLLTFVVISQVYTLKGVLI